MPKITVRKNLIIFHKPDEWHKIYHQILEDYGIKLSLSYVLKRELGFTIRHHKGLVPFETADIKIVGANYRYRAYYEDQIHLDFYSDAAQTWFQLKYL